MQGEMEIDAPLSKDKLIADLDEFIRIGYIIETRPLQKLGSLFALRILGGPGRPESVLEWRERRDTLRSVLREIAENEVKAALGDARAVATLRLFRLDDLDGKTSKRPVFQSEQGNLNDLLNEVLDGVKRKKFNDEEREPILAAIAEALLQREHEKWEADQSGKSPPPIDQPPPAEDIDTVEPRPAAADIKGSPSEPDRPADESAPSRPDSVGTKLARLAKTPAGVGVLLLLALTALLILRDLTSGGSPASDRQDTPARTPGSAELGSTSQQTKLYVPRCGVLASPEPAPGGAHSRLAFVDMDVAGRRIRQPPGQYPPSRFDQAVRIRPYEVLQVSVIVANAGPDAIARDVRLRLTFPTRPSAALSITATAEAPNARPTDTYRTAGVLSVMSLTGQPIRLGNFRNPQLQRNEHDQDFYWGRFESFPDCALESKRSDRSVEIAVPPPSIDGTVGVGLNDAYRVSILADVMPG
jgi:hypothetical protein